MNTNTAANTAYGPDRVDGTNVTIATNVETERDGMNFVDGNDKCLALGGVAYVF